MREKGDSVWERINMHERAISNKKELKLTRTSTATCLDMLPMSNYRKSQNPHQQLNNQQQLLHNFSLTSESQGGLSGNT